MIVAISAAVSTGRRFIHRRRYRGSKDARLNEHRDVLNPNIRLLSLAQARSLGMSRDAIDHAIRSGRWRRLLPHTYFVCPGRVTRSDLCRAGLLFADTGACISGTAATELHGPPGLSTYFVMIIANRQ